MSRLRRYPSPVVASRHSPDSGLVISDPEVSSADFVPLIQKLVEMRKEQPAGIIVAFTSICRRQGVTHVVESLACRLTQYTQEQILLSSCSRLAGAARATFWEPQGIQRLGASHSRDMAFRMPAWEDLQTIRNKFGFVLVDCPAMSESSSILSLSKTVDAVTLVVASGEMRREEIDSALRTLGAAAANVIGLVLNKRTDPVPRLFSRWL